LFIANRCLYLPYKKLKKGSQQFKKKFSKKIDCRLFPFIEEWFFWSSLCNEVEQKDLAESGTGLSLKPRGFASKPIENMSRTILVFGLFCRNIDYISRVVIFMSNSNQATYEQIMFK